MRIAYVRRYLAEGLMIPLFERHLVYVESKGCFCRGAASPLTNTVARSKTLPLK